MRLGTINVLFHRHSEVEGFGCQVVSATLLRHVRFGRSTRIRVCLLALLAIAVRQAKSQKNWRCLIAECPIRQKLSELKEESGGIPITAECSFPSLETNFIPLK